LKRLIVVLLAFIVPGVTVLAEEGRCAGYDPGKKQVYWGDLHVHTAYSLDAWGYGTIKTPADAYRFARGGELSLTDELSVKLDRPLDFMAVTDHAEWFDLLYICTDPEWSDDPYCDIMTEKAGRSTGPEVFAEYVLPTITKASPQPTPICAKDAEHCENSRMSQWDRIQQQTNEANAPCHFTALNGYEWSATPDYSHNHRNIIFRDENVTPGAIDYMHFPNPLALWQELDKQCKAETGCDAIAIPHNTNMGDGRSFDVETETNEVRALRGKFERLVEIHQEKGSSECLYAFGQPDEDCNFQQYLTRSSVPAEAKDYSEKEWEKMRSSYVRALLTRGLGVYSESGINPLQLGIISSTDNHAATGGFVEEDQWLGSVFGIGDLDRTMVRKSWNPGGLVAVWAEQNTRHSIFDALKRREVYATSGPRIHLSLQGSKNALTCDMHDDDGIPMGGSFKNLGKAPQFRIQAMYVSIPLQSIEIIKGEFRDGELKETTIPVWQELKGGLHICATWKDPDFDLKAPAFWYVRVLEAPTLRWSAHHCRKENRCDEFPGAETTLQERAWTSPIWYLP